MQSLVVWRTVKKDSQVNSFDSKYSAGRWMRMCIVEKDGLEMDEEEMEEVEMKEMDEN